MKELVKEKGLLSHRMIAVVLSATMFTGLITPVLAQEEIIEEEDPIVTETEEPVESDPIIEEEQEEDIEVENAGNIDSTIRYYKKNVKTLYENTQSGSYSFSEFMTFSFTPSHNGAYEFKIKVDNGEEYYSAFMFDDVQTYGTDQSNLMNNNIFSVILEKGHTYYLTVCTYNNYYNHSASVLVKSATFNNKGTYNGFDWSLDTNGTLTISGEGTFTRIDDYPWNQYYVRKIVFKEGITCIDAYAFINYMNLNYVEFPLSLVSIGNSAFSCSGIKSLTFRSVGYIDSYAFSYCGNLSSVEFIDPVGLELDVFEGCENVTYYYQKGEPLWEYHKHSFGAYKYKWVAKTYPKEYDIEYNLNGGVNNPANPAKGSNLSTVSLKKPTKNGYTFKGWYLWDTRTYKYNKISSIKKGNVTTAYIDAVWKINTYKITYNLNGGKNSTVNPKSYTVEDVIVLQEPTKKGYEFKGWYKDSKFTTPIEKIEEGSTGNLKLYAKWEAIQYNISYELNGGTNNSLNPSSYTIAKSVSLKKPTKAGYTFVGWYTTPDFSSKKVTSIKKGSTGDITYYAKWN